MFYHSPNPGNVTGSSACSSCGPSCSSAAFILGEGDRGACRPGRAWRRRPRWSWPRSAGTPSAATTPAGSYALLIAIGMTFGFIGDLALAGWSCPAAATSSAASSRLASATSSTSPPSCAIAARPGYGDGRRWGALAVWLLIGLVGWYFVVYRGAAEYGRQARDDHPLDRPALRPAAGDDGRGGDGAGAGRQAASSPWPWARRSSCSATSSWPAICSAA
jgi:hypothetical protein